MEHLIGYLFFSVGINLALFLVAYILQTDKITDISYSLTFIAIAAYSFLYSEQSAVDLTLLLLVMIWGIRLGSYLAYRIHQIGRDNRFDEIRTNFKSFFLFWLMQGLTCFIVMIPILMVNQVQGKKANNLFLLAILISSLGLIFETIADYQKFNFKKAHPKAFMHKGLWSIVQHPNYTGELVFWWGIFLASLPFTAWYYGIIGPLWISLIIIRFSGISILQKKWKTQYGSDPKFNAYSNTTSKLFPFIY